MTNLIHTNPVDTHPYGVVPQGTPSWKSPCGEYHTEETLQLAISNMLSHLWSCTDIRCALAKAPGPWITPCGVQLAETAKGELPAPGIAWVSLCSHLAECTDPECLTSWTRWVLMGSTNQPF